jgi:hypothetical protein
MEALNIRFTLDEDTPIDEYLEDGIITEAFTQEDDTYQAIIKDVDEVLIESLNADELAEFYGIDSEFVIACEVLEFS